MSDINITIPAGESKRLLVAGKRHNRNIVVTAEESGGGGNRYDEGYENGRNDGEQYAYDAFWDVYQENGNRTNYRYAFRFSPWTDVNFNPKYDIVCVGDASGALGVIQITDTKVSIDITNATETGQFFGDADKLVTIRKLIVGENTPFPSNFLGWTPNLKNITIEGTIGASFAIKYAHLLTADSVNSIINALKDLTGQTAQTLTFHSDVVGRMTEEQIQRVWEKNWELE